MKLLLIIALALLTSCASLNTYNAKAYKDSPVIFENDKGLAVVEDGPMKPNPVTQDEVDAGSVELF